MVRRVLTADNCARVAARLAADERLTVQSACADEGVSYGAVRKALHDYRKHGADTPASVIARAVDAQCEVLLERGDRAAGDGMSTSWYQWRLENKNPTEYGRKQSTSVELSGPDGGPVVVGAVRLTQDEALRQLAAEVRLNPEVRKLLSGGDGE